MMLGYWKRRYECVLQSYHVLEAKMLGLETERHEVYSQLKSATELLDRAKQQNQELEREVIEIDNMLDDTQKKCDKLTGEINMRDVKIENQQQLIQNMQRYITNLHSAIKVLNDVVASEQKPVEDFPLN